MPSSPSKKKKVQLPKLFQRGKKDIYYLRYWVNGKDRILREADLLRPRRPKREAKPIPVGKHRVQLDIQQLPSVKNGKKFEYKISMIHMRTRMKYSEIHDNARSSTVADVMEYNYSRPHMGIGNQPPLAIFKRDYKHHSVYYNVN